MGGRGKREGRRKEGKGTVKRLTVQERSLKP